MALNKRVRAHPVEKILATIPYSENYIRITVVDGTQHLVGNEPRHFVNEPRTFPKSLLESLGVFLFHVNAIGNSYHFNPFTRSLNAHSFCDGFDRNRFTCERRVFSSSIRIFTLRGTRVGTRLAGR